MKLNVSVSVASALLILTSCASPQSLTAQREISTTQRSPADDNSSYESSCAATMDKDWPKLLIASTFHRDNPQPPYDMSIQAILKSSNGSQTSYVVPNVSGNSAVSAPGLGTFPTRDGTPFADYQATISVTWQPKGVSGNSVYLTQKNDWAQTDRAGICFNGVGRIVPLKVVSSADLSSDASIKKLLYVMIKYNISTQPIVYTVKPTAGTVTLELDTNTLVPSAGADVSVQATYLRKGDLAKTSLKTIHIDPKSNGEQVEFTLTDLN